MKNWAKRITLATAALSLVVSGYSLTTGEVQAAEKTKLKVYTWYKIKDDNWDKVEAAYEKLNPNIEVDFVSNEDNNATEMLKKVDLAAAAGDTMDVIMVANDAAYVQRAEMGMFANLDSYIKSDKINFDEDYAHDTAYKGSYFGLPGKGTNFGLVMINKAHLDAAGLKVPTTWTWDDYLKYAEKMTKTVDGKKRYGTYFHSWPQYAQLGMINQYAGYGLVSDNGKTANVNDFLKTSLTLRYTAEKKKVAPTYAETISQKLNYRNMYFGQSASMILTGSFIIPEVGGTASVPVNFKTVFAPIPTNKAGQTPYSLSSGDILSVYKGSKNIKEAYKFVRWYTTKGIVEQAKYLPSYNKADLDPILDTIIAGSKNPAMIDKASLVASLRAVKAAKVVPARPYQAEVDKVFTEQFDRMMLKGQSVTTTMKYMKDRIQKVINKNK